jgi:hypothetical protein
MLRICNGIINDSLKIVTLFDGLLTYVARCPLFEVNLIYLTLLELPLYLLSGDWL